MPAKHSFRLYDDNGVHHRWEQSGQPDQNQTIDVPQADPLSRPTAQHQQLLAKNENIRLARSASLERQRRASRIRLSSANIERCSNTVAALRQVDDVLNRDSTNSEADRSHEFALRCLRQIAWLN